MSETAGNFNKRQASVDMQLEYEQRRHKVNNGITTPNSAMKEQEIAFLQKRKQSFDAYSYGNNVMRGRNQMNNTMTDGNL